MIVNTSAGFKRKALFAEKQFAQINIVTVEIQKKSFLIVYLRLTF